MTGRQAFMNFHLSLLPAHVTVIEGLLLILFGVYDVSISWLAMSVGPVSIKIITFYDHGLTVQ